MTETKPQTLGWGRFLLQFLTVAILYLLAQVPGVAIWGEIGPDGQLEISSTVMAGTTAFGMVVALLVSWLWLRKDGAVAEAWPILPKEGWGKTILIALVTTIAILGWFTLGTMALDSIGLGTPAVSDILGMVTQSGFHYVLWIVLVAWFAAGFGEELLYRGFLMDRLQRLKGVGSTIWGPIIIQALIFGISHGYQSLAGVIITGTVGLGLGWLRTRTGSLMPLILAHMAVDTFSMSMAYADKLGMIPAFST